MYLSPYKLKGLTVSPISKALCLSYKTWDFNKVHYYYIIIIIIIITIIIIIIIITSAINR